MTLTAEAITVGYRSHPPVLRDLTVAIEHGRVTAIVGPNGAGKTTFLRSLGGMHPLTSGRILLGVSALSEMPLRSRAGVIAYVAQRPSVAAHFTVREVVALGRFALGPAPDAVERALARLHLIDLADRWFHELSVGQQHRVAFARAIAQLDGWQSRPTAAAVLLADEPLAAMDPMHAIEIMRTLRSLASDGVCVVVVVHDVNAASQMSDDAIVLSADGSILRSGEASRTLTPDVLESVFGVRYHPVTIGESVILTVAPDLESGREEGSVDTIT